MSLGESAETQLWSSWLSSGSGSVLRVLEVGASLSVVRVLRFFGLSPLNVRGLTIVVWGIGCWSLEICGGEKAGRVLGMTKYVLPGSLASLDLHLFVLSIFSYFQNMIGMNLFNIVLHVTFGNASY